MFKFTIMNKKYNTKTTKVNIPIDAMFKKKVCVDCNCKLERFVETEKSYDGEKVMGFTTYVGEHYESEINYKCNNCGKVYTIEDFSKRNNKKDM